MQVFALRASEQHGAKVGKGMLIEQRKSVVGEYKRKLANLRQSLLQKPSPES